MSYHNYPLVQSRGFQKKRIAATRWALLHAPLPARAITLCFFTRSRMSNVLVTLGLTAATSAFVCLWFVSNLFGGAR